MKPEQFKFDPIKCTPGNQLIQGLTKREYFAAMAMQAILSKPVDNIKQAAKESVIAADALIKALNEIQP